jgi:hypothetical protein
MSRHLSPFRPVLALAVGLACAQAAFPGGAKPPAIYFQRTVLIEGPGAQVTVSVPPGGGRPSGWLEVADPGFQGTHPSGPRPPSRLPQENGSNQPIPLSGKTNLTFTFSSLTPDLDLPLKFQWSGDGGNTAWFCRVKASPAFLTVEDGGWENKGNSAVAVSLNAAEYLIHISQW